MILAESTGLALRKAVASDPDLLGCWALAKLRVTFSPRHRRGPPKRRTSHNELGLPVCPVYAALRFAGADSFGVVCRKHVCN